MTLFRRTVCCLIATAIAVSPSLQLTADEQAAPTVYPMAVFEFQERGADVEDFGGQVTDLLFADLVARENMFLVEREELDKILDEQELSAAGLTNPEASNQVGQLTGARILVTGSVFQVGDNVYVVAKLIGTETSRVLGASAKGKATETIDQIVSRLADGISARIETDAAKLMAAPRTSVDILAMLKKSLSKKARPSVWIEVVERHLGQPAVDPAVETELAMLCSELGFQVIDRSTGSKSDADILLMGDAFSQFAARHGNFVSVRSRLELKAVNRESAEVIAVDRQTGVSVDLAEMIAAKNGLQQSADQVALRLLPKLVAPKPTKKKK